MTNDELNNEYFEWMYQLVCNGKEFRRLSYRKLLSYLHSKEFIYTLAMDGNRAEDGIDLRYRFGYEHKYLESIITSFLDNRSCSVLEMLVALAMRCEEHIMDDPDIGNRTGEWFWTMITNLGLKSMTDSKFNKSYVNGVILTFLNRQYNSNGEGGLFTVNHCGANLRDVEIWYQMCCYLDSII